MAATLIAQPEKFGASCDQGGQQHSTFSGNSGSSSAGTGRRLPAAPADVQAVSPSVPAPKQGSAAAGISWYSATALSRHTAEVASRTPPESGSSSSSSSGGIGESSPDVGHSSAGLSGAHLAAESPVAGLDSGCLSCDDNAAVSVGAQSTTIEDRLLHSYKALNTAVDSKIQAVLSCFSFAPASVADVDGAQAGGVRSAACSDSGTGSGVPASTSGCPAGQRSRRSCTSSTDSEAGVGLLSADHSRGPFPLVVGSPRSRPAASSGLVESSRADVGCPGGAASSKAEPPRLLHHLRLQLPPMPARTSSSSSGGCCDSPRAGSAPTSTASPGRRSASDDCCCSSGSSSSSSSVDSAPSSWSFANADAFASDLILPAATAADPDGSNEDAASVATDVLLQTADDDIAMVEALLSSDSEAAAGGRCSTSHSSSTRSSFDWQRRAATAGSSPCGTPGSCASSTGTVATAAVSASAVAISSSSRGSRSSESSRSCGLSSTPVVAGPQPTPAAAVGAAREHRTISVDGGGRSESRGDSGSGESRYVRSVREVESSSIGRCPDEPASASLPSPRASNISTSVVAAAAAASAPQVRETVGSAEVRRVADGRLATVPVAARCAKPELDVRNAFGGAGQLAGPSTGSCWDDVHLHQACGRQRPPDCTAGAGGLLVQGTESNRSAGSSASVASSGVSSPACDPRLSLLRTEQRSTSRGRDSTGRSPGRQTSADAASPSFGRALLRNLSTRSRRDGSTAGSAATGKSASGGDDLSAGRQLPSVPAASRPLHLSHDPPDAVTGFHRADGGRFSLRSRTLADGGHPLVAATSSQRLPAATGYQSAAASEVRVREPTGTVAAISRGGGGTAAAAGTATRAPMLLGGALRTSASMERLEQEKAVWRRRKSYDPRRAVATAAAVAAAATSASAPVVPVGARSTAAPMCAGLDAPHAGDHVTPILMPNHRHTASLSSQPATTAMQQQQQHSEPSARANSSAAAATASEACSNRGIATAPQSQQHQQTTHSRRHLPIAADAALIGDDDEEVFGTSHELEQANFRTSREQEIAHASSALAANLGMLSSLGSGSSGSRTGGGGPTVTATSVIAASAAAATVAGKEHWSTRPTVVESVGTTEQWPSKREFCAGTAAVSVMADTASTRGALRPAEEEQQQPDRARLLARQHQLPLSPLPAPAVAESSVTAAAGTTASAHDLKQQLHAAAPDRSHRSRTTDGLIATSSTSTAEARPSAFRRCGSFRTSDGDGVPSPSGHSIAALGLPSTASDVPGQASPSMLPDSSVLQPPLAKAYRAAEEEPYNAVVMASIQRLSARLSATSHRLVGMLRDRLPPSAAAGLPVSDTAGMPVPGASASLDGFDVLDAATGGFTSGISNGGASVMCCDELGSALSSLRQVERNIGALERSLLLHHGPLSLVTSTSANQDQSRYLAELRQLRSDITGFKPVEDDVPSRTSAPVAAAAVVPGQAAHLPVGAVGVTTSSGAAFFYAGPSSSAPTAHVRQQLPSAVGATTAASAARSAAAKANALPPVQTNGIGLRLGSGASALASSSHGAAKAAAIGASARRSFY